MGQLFKNSKWQNNQNNVNSISEKTFEKCFVCAKTIFTFHVAGVLMI